MTYTNIRSTEFCLIFYKERAGQNPSFSFPGNNQSFSPATQLCLLLPWRWMCPCQRPPGLLCLCVPCGSHPSSMLKDIPLAPSTLLLCPPNPPRHVPSSSLNKHTATTTRLQREQSLPSAHQSPLPVALHNEA